MPTQSDGHLVAVVYLVDGTPAAAQLRVGDVVVEADGHPINEFIAGVSLRWSDPVPATSENIDAERVKWMSRGPVGAQMALTVLRRGMGAGGGGVGGGGAGGDTNAQETVVLAASADEPFTRSMQKLNWLPDDYEDLPVEKGHWITFSTVTVEAGTTTTTFGVLTIPTFDNHGGLKKKVRQALASFHREKVRGVIVDLRGNDGGDDDEVPDLMQFFCDDGTKFLIEKAAVPPATLAILPPEAFELGPPRPNAEGFAAVESREGKPSRKDLRFVGPVVCLVDRRTLSNGDIAAGSFRRMAEQEQGSTSYGPAC